MRARPFEGCVGAVAGLRRGFLQDKFLKSVRQERRTKALPSLALTVSELVRKMQDGNNSGWAPILSWRVLIPQTSLATRYRTRTKSSHYAAYMRKGSTWCMADGLMTKGNARPLRAPSLRTGGEGKLFGGRGHNVAALHQKVGFRDPAEGGAGGHAGSRDAR